MKSNIKSKDYQNFLDDLKGYYQENEQKEEENIPVGTRIRQIRQMQGVDSATLAKNAGIDKKYLAEFMVFCRPDYYTLLTKNDLEFGYYIQQQYKVFLQLKKLQ